MDFFDILDESLALVEKDDREEEENKWLRSSDSSSTFLDEKTPASQSEDEALSASDSEWEDEIEPTIPGTSQVLLHEWMNGLVIFYNQCLEIGTEGVACDPVALRLAVDNMVKAVLHDSQKKMLLGALSLYEFVVAVLSRFWICMHPCKIILAASICPPTPGLV